jgi:hypothetical protein
MNKFKKIVVDSFGIQPEGDNFKIEEINKNVRAVAERNNLQAGDKVNADIAYTNNGKYSEALATVEFTGEELVAESGYSAEKFDKGEEFEPSL